MKTRYNKTIVLDIDGVIANFEEEFCERFGCENRHLYNLEQRYPDQADLINEFVNAESTYEHLVPIFGGTLLTRQAYYSDWYVLLMTSRPRHLAQITKEWLEGFHIPYHEMWFANQKAAAIEDYNKMYPRRQAIRFVDDSPKAAVEVSRVYGMITYVYDQPWNQDVFPRVRYNENDMRLECRGAATPWFDLWRG